jgi:hypothetical protein
MNKRLIQLAIRNISHKHNIVDSSQFIYSEINNANKYIAALEASRAELLAALEAVCKQTKDCERCEGKGIELGTKNACCKCGGYGFNPCGDIRDAIVEGRSIIEKGKMK